MFNIKVYDSEGKFIQTLREKEISCEYSFGASVNGGFTTLKFEYYGEFELDHKQRIKIYKGEQCIYQGFITGITKRADKGGKRQIVTLSGLIGLLAFKTNTTTSINQNPSSFLRTIFSQIPGIDISGIQDYSESISFETSEKTQLGFLQDILNHVEDYALFLDSDNKVTFKPYSGSHTLTYTVDCFNIELAEDSSSYYNDITLYYNGGSYAESDIEGIAKYGVNSLILEDDRIKNLSTAKLRVKSLLKEHGIQRNYKISVNSNYNYYDIKPGQLLSVRNTDWIIENKPIKQIQYSKDTAIISLESYKPIENFIINQK